MRKYFEINSIRHRMVLGFLFLTFLIFILAIVSLSIMDRIVAIARMNSSINQLEAHTLNLIKLDNDFFDLETINENYFSNHKSQLLERRDSLNSLIKGKIQSLSLEGINEKNNISLSLAEIDHTLVLYNQKFVELEKLVFKKGFKDFGIEGSMRFHAHALEESVSGADVTGLLYLRRHEKDFQMRNDPMYLQKFKSRTTLLLNSFEKQPQKNASAIVHLKNYQRLFFELAAVQNELGLSSHTGLRSELNRLTDKLSKQYYLLSEYSNENAEISFYNARIVYISLLFAAVLFSLFSGYWISKKLSDPIAKLSKLIYKAILSGNATKVDFRLKNAAIEIKTLADSFILLMNQAKSQMDSAKEKSKQLRQKNLELKKLNLELDNFLYSTAHDLRSPLASLLGLINIIRLDNHQPELEVYLDMMKKSIHRSEDFISQIVSYSLNKKTELHPERLDIAQLISSIFENHQFVEGASRIRKVVTTNSMSPFFSDKNRITIIFNNLISNAVKYADPEKDESFIKIAIRVDSDETSIEFSDNGVGIGEEHIKYIFDMFYRAHVDSRGSGLGLFIFKETIAKLDGSATVESVVGVGTKFFIRLPNLQGRLLLQQSLPFNVLSVEKQNRFA